ncbi:uncharacterized protein LOC111707067 [Eurytemora carolleeae]|uniref:uncharacterized protein LOC111707067 n=1 Tax=Eurytemora carolleeae TaxID=1294199 RepID=UPI000C78E77D|nr:uncharacterized protein LOC111707067 [Eurytemora carolleeae]|eukprot:XP_023335835.1 uncharacterized protein LOC111707067 [Eurytemora affinis]
MEELLRHNLDHVLINIFLRLDGKSLKNVQLVNHEWDNFVRTRIWNSKRNRKIIKDNLWCNSTYSTRHIETGKCITSLSCDNSILVCGFTDGTVNIYHLDSGELIIELRTNSSAEQCTSTQVGLSTSLVAAMSVGTRFKDRTGGILFKVIVWNRVDWSEVTSLESSARTKFWISDKYLGIRNDDDLVIWKVRKHRDTSIHKYLYIHLKEVTPLPPA